MPHTFTAAAPRPGHTDIDPATVRTFRDLRTGRAEVWACLSTDRVWGYERLEDTATTWRVVHLPTGRTLDFELSLPKARRGTASGWALREIERQDAAAVAPRCSWRSPWGTASVCSQTAVRDGRCAAHPVPAAV